MNTLRFLPPDVARVTVALTAWVAEHATVPLTDPRAVTLLGELPKFISDLSLALDDQVGVAVRVAEASSGTAAKLRAGLTWLRGGDWWLAVLEAW